MISVGTGAGFVFAGADAEDGGLIFAVVADFFAGAGFSNAALGLDAAVASFVSVAAGTLAVVSGQGDCGNAQHAALAGNDPSINPEIIQNKLSKRDFVLIDRSPFTFEFITCASSRCFRLTASSGSGSNSNFRMTQTHETSELPATGMSCFASLLDPIIVQRLWPDRGRAPPNFSYSGQISAAR